MATERQRKANRANAARSTGPRTASGRRRSSQNARRHGLSTPPEASEVLRWYRIIVGDEEAQLPSLAADDRERALLRLAEAEARLARAREAEHDCLATLVDVFQEEGGLDLLRAAGSGIELDEERPIAWLIDCLETEKDRELLALRRFLEDLNPNRSSNLLRSMQTLRGYRRRAEGSRARALKVWEQMEERSQLQS